MAALIARIVIVWTAQLDEEQMQRDAAQARQRSGRSGANVEATDPRKNRIRTRTV